MKTVNEMGGRFTVNYHSHDGVFYADVFLATGGYCIVQFSGKNREESREKALDWIRKEIGADAKEELLMFEEYKTRNYTVSINKKLQRGYFEHNKLGEDISGELLFENDILIDYDGVFSLSTEIDDAIKILGFSPIKDNHEDS